MSIAHPPAVQHNTVYVLHPKRKGRTYVFIAFYIHHV